MLNPAQIALIFQFSQQGLGRGLAVLAAWALLNLVGGGYLLAHADRRYEAYYFHAMNVGWGLVNAPWRAGASKAALSGPGGLQAWPSCFEASCSTKTCLFSIPDSM